MRDFKMDFDIDNSIKNIQSTRNLLNTNKSNDKKKERNKLFEIPIHNNLFCSTTTNMIFKQGEQGRQRNIFQM